MNLRKRRPVISTLLAAVALVGCSSIAEEKSVSEARLSTAAGFSRELSSLASVGLDENPAETNPQNPAFLMEYIKRQEMYIPDGTTITTNGVASGPVMVFDGTTQIAELSQLAPSISLIELGFDENPVCIVLPEKSNVSATVSDGPCLF
jgi:hypothetical protein